MTTLGALTARYIAVFARMGVSWTILEPGVTRLDTHGGSFTLLVTPTDPGLLRLVTHELWPVGTTAGQALVAADQVNRRCAGVKASTNEACEALALAAEMVVAPDGLLPEEDLLVAVLHRSMRALADAFVAFCDEIALRSILTEG